jgi:hypothetical protein
VSGTATYLYCAVVRRTAPRLAGAPAGLPGTGPLRALDAGGGLWLVAADAPLDRFDAPVIERGLRDLDWVSECALAHEVVVEWFVRGGTVIPMKLFTLFTSDARALDHVARDRRRIDRVVARVAGRTEWVVRVLLGEAGPVAAAEPRGPAGGGRAFLEAKRSALDARRHRATAARTGVERLYAALGKRATAARRRPPLAAPPGGRRLLLDAAFLVARPDTAAFRLELKRAATPLRDMGCEVALTGPWPPYSFAGDA